MPDLNFGHTREEAMRLFTDAIDVWHISPDDLYIAVMRLVDIKQMAERRKQYQEDGVVFPTEWEGEE